jgi:hypothetical protein
MASALRKMTGIGADVRQIAALLQAKAPKGHMLAYITPQEAALLKAEGGSGKPHSDTGIPSFENEYAPGDFDSGPEIPYTVEQVGDLYPGGSDPNTYTANFAPPPPGNFDSSLSQPFSYEPFSVSGSGFRSVDRPGGLGITSDFGGYEGLRATPDSLPTPTLTAGGPRPEYSIFTKQDATGAATEAAGAGAGAGGGAGAGAGGGGMSRDTMTRLGLAAALGILGSKQSKKAAEEGQAGKREIQAMAAPYQAKGQELQAAAQRGELTPTGQQAIQAARAQAAQGAERRGGVGAQQTEAQVQALRQQLLSQQFDYGLKLANIGDQMAMGAIRTGLQADQYVNQLNQSFYTNMAYIAAGASPVRSQ